MAVIDGFTINGTSYDLRDKVAVRFNEAQTLTDAQKAIGRGNIDAVALKQGAANAGKVLMVGEDGNVTVGDAVQIDDTLQQAGQAADAAAVGAALGNISDETIDTETITVDKSTCTKMAAYMTAAGLITTKANCNLIYFACLPEMTYTISKVKSARFRVGYTTVVPASTVKASGIIENNTGTVISITPAENARYLVVYYYDGDNDTISESVIYNSIIITYEVETTEVTAVDKVARSEVEGKVDVAQGVVHAGKALIVGADGNVTTEDAGIPDAVKTALLELVRHVAYIDDQGRAYYNALYLALYNGEPSTSDVTPISGYYYNDNGDEVVGGNAWLEREYIPITAGQSYIWMLGFSGNYYYRNEEEPRGCCTVYRVVFYRSDFSLINRITSYYTEDIGYVEQRYFEFETPQDAAYIRLSWNDINLPGEIKVTIPNDLYAVHMVLCNPDDSDIDDVSALAAKMSIMRNGRKLDYYTSTWMKSVFGVLQGKSPESTGAGGITRSEKRITNRQSFLLQRGDILRFDGVKYGVRAERISDGSVEYTTAWVTDDADYVIGGVENG